MNLKQLPYWIIGALLAVILLMRGCEKPVVNDAPTVIKTTDTVFVYKIKTIKDTVYVPGDTKYIPATNIPIKIDTAAILKDYYAKRFYSDSIKIGDIGHVYIRDTISENRIIHRESWGDYTIPEKIVTNTTTTTIPPEHKNQVYVGFNIGVPYLQFGPEFTLKTKTDQLYKVGVGLSTTGPQLSFGMGWKIKLK